MVTFPQGALIIAQPQPRIEIGAELPDFRCRRSKRHPLPAMLSLACCTGVDPHRPKSRSRFNGNVTCQALLCLARNVVL